MLSGSGFGGICFVVVIGRVVLNIVAITNMCCVAVAVVGRQI